MSTFVQYQGNGSNRTFNVPFPYLEPAHVKVKLGGFLCTLGVHYDFTSANTIQIRPQFTPAVNTTVELRRETPQSALVTYQNGAVLSAEDLNTATLQSLFISEEIRDYYEAAIAGGFSRLNNGTAVSAQEAIDAAVQGVLDSALLASLQQRIGDIDLNAQNLIAANTAIENLQDQIDALSTIAGENIATLIANEQTQRIAGDTALAQTIALIGAKNGDNTAFILDMSKVRVDATTSLGTRLSGIDTAVGSNAAAIATEITARTNADTALAQSITNLSSTVTSNVGTLTARIATEETTRANQDSALASSISALSATVTNNNNTLSARITSEEAARASGDNANASSITALTATVNGQSSQIATIQNVVAGPGGLSAQYMVKLDVNGRVIGFGLYNNGATSDFIVVADRFAIVDPANTNSAPKVPFVVTGGVVYMQNVVIGNALIENLTISKLINGTLNADMQMGTGKIIFDNGSYLMAQGVGFGSSGQFLVWFGPRPSGGNLSLCTEANAVYYLKTNGQAYFGGTLNAGIIKNQGQTTDTSATAFIDVGPFTTNGNVKNIVLSYEWFRSYRCASNTGSISGTGSAQILLQRSIGGGAWVTIATLNANETARSVYVDGEPGIPDVVTYRISGSVTVSDYSAATNDIRLRGILNSRTLPTFGGTSITDNVISQNIAVVSTE